MPRQMSTILATSNGKKHKLLKIWFGKDGSLYVSAPYHPSKSATLVKRTVCYDTGFMQVTLQVPAVVDAGLFEDEESQIKLSYHPSGFCQFSGNGLMSGVDEKGKPKGIGVWSRQLNSIDIGFGPVFIAQIYGLSEFATTEKVGRHDYEIDFDTIPTDRILSRTKIQGSESSDDDEHPDKEDPQVTVEALFIEGFYLRPEFRRFIVTDFDGKYSIFVNHPSGAVMKLRVILAPVDTELPGFLGFYTCRLEMGVTSKSGFILNGPADNFRENSRGQRIGDVISCECPKSLIFQEGRTLNQSNG